MFCTFWVICEGYFILCGYLFDDLFFFIACLWSYQNNFTRSLFLYGWQYSAERFATVFLRSLQSPYLLNYGLACCRPIYELMLSLIYSMVDGKNLARGCDISTLGLHISMNSSLIAIHFLFTLQPCFILSVDVQTWGFIICFQFLTTACVELIFTDQ